MAEFYDDSGTGNYYDSAFSPVPFKKRLLTNTDMTPPDLGATVPGAGSVSSALSPSPAGPTLEGTQEYKDYLDTGSKLRSALQPNQVSMPRAIIGSLLSRRNPMLGSVITGDFQRNRQIQPLEQQYGLLGDMIKNNRAMQMQDLNMKNIGSEITERGRGNDIRQQIADTKETPPAKSAEEQTFKSLIDSGVEPLDAFTQIKNAKEVAAKTPNAVEGVKQSLLDAMNKGDKEGIAKYGKQLDALSDPSGDKAAMRALTMESVRQRIAEKNAKDSSLSPKAQQVLMETEPTLQQVDQLIAKLEPLKDNNTSRLTISRIGYALGHASPEGSLADDISKLELDRVVAGARILKGSSRAYQALELAMKHAPNSWVDTPKLMYNKLTNIRQNLADVENDAKSLGKTKLSTGEAEAATSSNQPAGGKYRRQSRNVVVEQ
jgi:hypothetical protein